jgi:hypothetical protein
MFVRVLEMVDIAIIAETRSSAISTFLLLTEAAATDIRSIVDEWDTKDTGETMTILSFY